MPSIETYFKFKGINRLKVKKKRAKKICRERNEIRENSIIKIGDCNTHSLIMKRTTRQKINTK